MMPTRYWFVVGTFLLSMLLWVDRICISVAEAPVRGDLGLSKEAFGWVMSAFALGYALCQAPAGALSDRFGARRVLASVVVVWSLFTGLTAGVWNLASILIVRLLFGAGEAGAFPGVARAIYSWIPVRERGLVQGINFSGARLGAAFALPAVATSIKAMGWRYTFVSLMLIGFVWAAWWWYWFRDEPGRHPKISQHELKHILETRQQRDESPGGVGFRWQALLASVNVWLLCAQYFASNFTVFFCLTWLHPYLKEKYALEAIAAGMYASAPFVCGAVGNWVSGWLVDRVYRSGHWRLSRLLPAAMGFLLAAVGVIGCARSDSALESVVWLGLAVFGADMTLSPSWSVCIDIGGRQSGLVSGTMNMAGNLGSFVTSLAFPYLTRWTGSQEPFFFVAASLSGVAIVLWLLVEPRRPLERTT
jgi:MFS transporter, ACS family, glucarate transporter